MITLLGSIILLAVVIFALQLLGAFKSPYVHGVRLALYLRLAFYVLLLLFALTVGADLMHPSSGHDPSVKIR
jgi:hypothetical protein